MDSFFNGCCRLTSTPVNDVIEIVSPDLKAKDNDSLFGPVYTNSSSMAGLFINASGVIEHATPSVCDVTGFKAEQLIHQSLSTCQKLQ